MTIPKPTVITWSGAASISEAKQALTDRSEVRFELPHDLHNAIAQVVSRGTQSKSAHQVKISGGPEMIAALASIATLEALGELVAPVREADMSVTIVSPAPCIILSPR